MQDGSSFTAVALRAPTQCPLVAVCNCLPGAKNPRVKHGHYTKAAIEERRWINQLLKDACDLIDEVTE
jgi:hypothetical protein